MSQKKKTLLLVAGVAVVVLLIMMQSSKKNAEVSESPSPSVSATPKSSGATTIKSQYDALVKEYEGRRIQFDKNCQAIPNQLTFKTGTKVMFDNRSGDVRTFALNSTVYNIPGYGWRLVTLSNKTLPFTYVIDCGSAQNVGTIMIQK